MRLIEGWGLRSPSGTPAYKNRGRAPPPGLERHGYGHPENAGIITTHQCAIFSLWPMGCGPQSFGKIRYLVSLQGSLTPLFLSCTDVPNLCHLVFLFSKQDPRTPSLPLSYQFLYEYKIANFPETLDHIPMLTTINDLGRQRKIENDFNFSAGKLFEIYFFPEEGPSIFFSQGGLLKFHKAFPGKK